MFVFLASVHHTGTQFTQKLFADHGYELTDLTPMEASDRQGRYLHRCHIADAVAAELTMWLELTSIARHSIDAVPLVIPLRHPIAVGLSWRLRDKSFEDMYRQFRILIDEIACGGPRGTPYHPYLLPIDHSDRALFLDQIAAAVGHPLITDWPVVASKKDGYYPENRRIKFNTDEREILFKLRDEPFLTELYPEPWKI